MKSLLAASLLALSIPAAAQSATAPQVEALTALARTYGVVRYFHPSDSLDQVSWERFQVHAASRMGEVTDRREIGPRLEELFVPIVEGFKVVASGGPTTPQSGDGPRVEWRHLGYGMEADPNSPYVSWRTHHDPLHNGKVKGPYFQHRAAAEASVHSRPVMRVPVAPGLEAHVAVSLPLSAVKVGQAQKDRLERLAKTLESVTAAGEPVTRARAHADGIALWNVARHFYPYWSVIEVDWDAALAKWLAEQPLTQSRAQLRDALRRLAAPLEDGHASIADPKSAAARGFLPVSVRPLGDRWVIDASRLPEKARAGDVILAVDGRPAQQWFAQRLELVSGSPQLRRWRAARELVMGVEGASIALRLARGRETVEVTLAYQSGRPLEGPRPAALHEVRPGVHYVDVTRFDRAAFDKALETLKGARGIVFDLRGYPARDAVALVPFWLRGEDTAQWMFVPRFDKPFGESGSAWSVGWQARPNGALDKPLKVALVDARAISYAESLAAYFPDQKVGPLVGEPTAGTNGNVARATLPSGMTFFFTSMRVTRHDGTTLVHGKGIAPDEAASPTLEGLRAGRDEVLERAAALVESRVPR